MFRDCGRGHLVRDALSAGFVGVALATTALILLIVICRRRKNYREVLENGVLHTQRFTILVEAGGHLCWRRAIDAICVFNQMVKRWKEQPR